MGNIKPLKTIKSKQRLLCLTINHLKEEEEAAKPSKKKLKRKNKLSKDEKVILKR